jgi:myosin-5
MYWDDKYNTQGISEAVCLFSFCSFHLLDLFYLFCVTSSESIIILQVVSAMREMVNKDTANLVSNSFLLDDDLR